MATIAGEGPLRDGGDGQPASMPAVVEEARQVAPGLTAIRGRPAEVRLARQRRRGVNFRAALAVEEATRLCMEAAGLRAVGARRRAPARTWIQAPPGVGRPGGTVPDRVRVSAQPPGGGPPVEQTPSQVSAPDADVALGSGGPPVPGSAEFPGASSGRACSSLGFDLTGVVDDRVVTARWEGGRLVSDPLLVERARLVVDLGEVFGGDDGLPRIRASLDGSPRAVFLTLVRACSRVIRARYGLGPQA